MEELVSIVVPVYNAEKYLDKCVGSIVNQTYKNLEVILVDDGSSDGSLSRCRDWSCRDQRIRVIHKENGGPGTARNAGLAAAAGKYLLFLDSDDYIHASTVEKCVCAAGQYHAEVVIFGRNEVSPDGTVTAGKIRGEKAVFHQEDVRQMLLPYMFTYELGFGVGAWGKLYDVSLIRRWNIRFQSKEEILYEDGFFTLELFSKVSSAVILPECLYYYCKQENSFSRTYREDRQKQNDLFLRKSVAFIQQEQLPEKLILHVQSRYHGFTLGTLMQIIRSDLSGKEKRKQLHSIYRNPLLRETLHPGVWKLDARLPRIFWMLLRYRCYALCDLLLLCNAYR